MISLISVIIWQCPFVKSSLVLLERGVCYAQCVLLIKLLVFAWLHFVLQGLTCLLFLVSLDFLLLYSNPMWWKDSFFFCCSKRSWRSSSDQSTSIFSASMVQALWCLLVCLGNRLRLLCRFWDCTQVVHFRLFVGYKGYSISSKEFLPTAVDNNGHLNQIRPFSSMLVHWFLKCRCSLLPSPAWPCPAYLDLWI